MALSEEIIDFEQGKFHGKFLEDDKGLSKNAQSLYQALKREVKKKKKEISNMKEAKLSIPQNFQEKNTEIPGLDRFVKEIVDLIKNSKDKTVKIKSNNQYFSNKIKMLAKYVLIEKDGKICFDTKFPEGTEHLPLGLKSFRKSLEISLKDQGIGFDGLKDYSFLINNFPKTHLPNDSVEQVGKNINDFLSKLRFAANQLNEIELTDRLKKNICEEFGRMKGRLVYSRFVEGILNWLKSQRGYFISYHDGDNFFQAVKRELLGDIHFNTKEPSQFSTGREKDLDKLSKLLNSKSSGNPIVWVYGEKGVGKSELVRMYISKKEKDYDSIIWIDAQDTSSLKSSFCKLADVLGIDAEIHKKREDISSMMKKVVKRLSDDKSLFIFDHVTKATEESLLKFSEFNTNGHVFITSVKNKLKEVKGKAYKLQNFTEAEAKGFIKKALDIQDDLQDEEVGELIKSLKYYPRALVFATFLVRDFDHILKNINELYGLKGLLNDLEGKDLSSNKSVLDTLVSLRCSMIQNLSEEISNITSTIAYLAQDDIPCNLFKVQNQDRLKLAYAIEELKNRSIVSSDTPGILSVDEFVQEIIRSNLELEDREANALKMVGDLFLKHNINVDDKHYLSFLNHANHEKLLKNYIDEEFPDGSYALHLFAKYGKEEEVSKVLGFDKVEKKDLVNVLDSFGMAPLHYAAQEGYLKIVNDLLSNGAEFHLKSNCNLTPLHFAAENGHIEIVNVLLKNSKEKQGINDREDSRRTALHLAAKNGHKEVVQSLIEGKAKSNIKDIYGCIPLHYAARNKHKDIVKSLLGNGTCDASVKDELGYTALHWACVAGADYDIIELLAKKGHVSTRDIEGQKPLDLVSTDHKDYDKIKTLLSYKTNEPYHDLHSIIRSGNIKSFLETKDVNVQDDYGHTLLHYAVQHNKESVEKLLLKGIDVSIQDNSGYAPLHVAVMNSNREIVEILLGHKTNDPRIMDNLGRTPLFLALERNQPDIALLLLEDKYFDDKCINDKCGYEGNTLLYLAIKNKYIKIVNALYGKGADVYVNNYEGCNSYSLIIEGLKHNKISYNEKILIEAVKENNFDAVKLLVDSGVNINQKDNEGFTALHFAVEEEDGIRIVEYLIENGAEVDAQDNQGWTPLHWAAQEGNVKIVELLLDNTADPNKVASSGGFTPLHAVADAEKNKINIKVAELLINKKADVTAKNTEGKTPLTVAVKNEYWNLCEVLLGHMEDEKINKVLKALEGPQHNGTFRVGEEVLKMLQFFIENDKEEICTKVLKAAFGYMKKESIDYIVKYKDKQVRTLLYHAASKGLIDIVKLLLKNNADVCILETTKNTILHAAVESKNEGVVSCIIEKLKENKKLQDYINKKGWCDRTPLHVAATHGSVEIFDLLSGHGAKIPKDKKKDLICTLETRPKEAGDEEKYQEIISRIEKPGKPTTNPGASGERTVTRAEADSSVRAEYFNEEQREEIFSRLSKFASANFSNTSVQSVKQDLFSPFFGECEGGGRCIPITHCFSQALFLCGNRYVSSSLKALTENYNCRKQNKQTSKREAFAFSRLLIPIPIIRSSNRRHYRVV